MADVDTLTFTNAQLLLLNNIGGLGTQLNGALAVDYTNNIVAGNLTVDPLLDINLKQISGFQLTTNSDGTYTITGSGNLTLGGNTTPVPGFIAIIYTGKMPSAVGSVEVYLGTDTNGAGLLAGANVPVSSVPVCFVAGTSISTKAGAVRVEDLAVGDLVVTVSGDVRPVTWIGCRKIACGGARAGLAPVRIRAGAFGGELPVRDLLVSPGHPVLVGADSDGAGGHLVPTMCLINGTTIEREATEQVTYWHVELDAHDILLAEGLPAENYLDWGDRVFFEEGSDHALANPDFVVPGLAGRCRPVALDGEIVEAERRRIDAIFATQVAGACVWPDSRTSGDWAP